MAQREYIVFMLTFRVILIAAAIGPFLGCASSESVSAHLKPLPLPPEVESSQQDSADEGDRP